MIREEWLNRLFKRLTHLIIGAISLSVVSGLLMIYLILNPSLSLVGSNLQKGKDPKTTIDPDRIENGIHVRTGLVEGKGLMAVVNNCTNCHSAKLVIQNRMNREKWNSTIQWMQETQNLWDLGKNHEVIVNYLVTYYPPQSKKRREGLKEIEWYVLED